MNFSADVGTVSKEIRAYVELLKPRLSLLVAFSCGFGNILATSGSIDWFRLSLILCGGFLLSGASVTINQVIEIKEDGLMNRTMNRPLPTGRVSVTSAVSFALVIMAISLWLLYLSTNPLTVGLSVLSMGLYSFVYTPLKKVGPVAVLSLIHI